MTDKQANNITKEQAIRILHPDTCVEAIDDYEEAGNYEHAYDTAILMAIAALREKQEREKGCRYCEWVDITQAHEDEDGPLNYCRACGRYLRNPGEIGTKID